MKKMEDAVATAQWLATKQEWEKHIEFIKRHLNEKITQEDLDDSIQWYERIFGKYLIK